MKAKLLALSLLAAALSGCAVQSTTRIFADDPRVSIATSMEQQNQLADALIQWQILDTLYPYQTEIESKLDSLQQRITANKAKLQNQYSKIEASDNNNAKQKLLLRMLALTPNDEKLKEALRDMVWDDALEEADEKTQNIVKYFEVNQQKAQKSIELANVLEQGDSFVASRKFTGLLQVADRLDNLSPGHEKVKVYKFTAFTGIAEQHMDAEEPMLAITSFNQALPYADSKSKQKIVKRVKQIRSEVSEEYFAEAQRVFNQDLSLAISLYEKILEINPQHSRANRQLTRAQRIQENLLKIQKMDDD
jgi:hypothetical protein